MAITNSIVNDVANGTCSIDISSGSVIESISYDNSTKSFTFATQSPFSLSASDYLSFQKMLDAFNVNVISVFNFNVQIGEFSISQITDTDDGVGSLSYKIYKANHPLYDLTATYPSGSVSFGNRNQPTTLNFNEWTYFHQTQDFYEIQIRKRYGL